MSQAANGRFCPDNEFAALVAMMQQSAQSAMAELDALVPRFPDDARLHFLRGSIMASKKEYEAARKAMRRAVDLAPDFAIARFQLGFLLLTSGEVWPAQEAWGPLHGLSDDYYLVHFVRGLCHLIRDEFAEAIADLERGIAANQENPPLNNDMRMIIDEMHEKDLLGDGPDNRSDVSSAQLLLQQAALRSTRH